jgi:hypothetical protein
MDDGAQCWQESSVGFDAWEEHGASDENAFNLPSL